MPSFLVESGVQAIRQDMDGWVVSIIAMVRHDRWLLLLFFKVESMGIPLSTSILCAMFRIACISPAVAGFLKNLWSFPLESLGFYWSLFVVSSCRNILVWSSRMLWRVDVFSSMFKGFTWWHPDMHSTWRISCMKAWRWPINKVETCSLACNKISCAWRTVCYNSLVCV
jgi:hypothetical protein